METNLPNWLRQTNWQSEVPEVQFHPKCHYDNPFYISIAVCFRRGIWAVTGRQNDTFLLIDGFTVAFAESLNWNCHGSSPVMRDALFWIDCYINRSIRVRETFLRQLQTKQYKQTWLSHNRCPETVGSNQWWQLICCCFEFRFSGLPFRKDRRWKSFQAIEPEGPDRLY